MTLKIPVNTTADVFVPNRRASQVFESGAPAEASPGVKFLRGEDGMSVYAVQSGDYEFTVKK
jgi:alpha-L-rhamnosidase